jgi:hypothetical protein
LTELPSMMAAFGARLIQNGYHILPIEPGTKRPGTFSGEGWRPMSDWQRHCERPTRSFEHEMWTRWPGCAVGVAGGVVAGIDIDVLDGDAALAQEKLARDMLGDTPALRIGLAPKRMLIYRTAAPFAGRKRKPLELLCRGSQFLAYAIHPDTGQPYAWPDTSLIDIDIGRLPEITEAQALAWIDAAYAALPKELQPVSLIGNTDKASAWRGPSDPRGTMDAIRSALQFIPNDDVDGASWIQIGNALKAALGAEGRDLWLEWSKSSSKSGMSGNTNTAERRWQSFRPHSIGAGSIYWLAEQRGWVPDAAVVLNAAAAEAAGSPHPAQGMIDRLRAQAAPVPAVEAPENVAAKLSLAHRRVETVMSGLDGALRMFVDYALEGATSPQPFLALGAALCMVGTVAGRKYRTETDLRTNLSVIALADSGSGKERARKCVKNALYAAGLGQHLGGEELASGPGLLASLAIEPSRLFQINELGKFMATVSGKNVASHKAEIWTNITKLATSADSVYLGTEYADQKARARTDINQPCASIYGDTVPGPFWAALESGFSSDGSLARFLVFETTKNYPDRVKRITLAPPPAALVERLKQIADGVMDRPKGNLDGVTAHTAVTPYMVPNSPEANALFDKLTEDQTSWLRDREGTNDSAAIARLWENAAKLALIKAVSRDPSAPRIEAADVVWAQTLAEHCITVLIRSTERFVSENEYEASYKRVQHLIMDAGTLTRSDITKKTQGIPPKRREEILRALVETGQIAEEKLAGGSPGRPAVRYRAILEAEAA